MGLLDYYNIDRIQQFAKALHSIGKEAWIAGSVTRAEIAELWATNVDVICVRSAACTTHSSGDRFGAVDSEIVNRLSPKT